MKRTTSALVFIAALALSALSHAQTLEVPNAPGVRKGDIHVHQTGNLVTPNTRVIVEGDGNVRVDRLSANEFATIVKMKKSAEDLYKQAQDLVAKAEAILAAERKVEYDTAVAHGAHLRPYVKLDPNATNYSAYGQVFQLDEKLGWDGASYDGPFLTIRQKSMERVYGGGEVYQYINSNGLISGGTTRRYNPLAGK